MKALSFPKLSIVLIIFIAIAFSACGGSRKGFSLNRDNTQKDLASCLELMKKKKHEKAIQCLEAYKSHSYGSPEAAEAELLAADAYFRTKDYLVAAEAYNLFLQSYPTHPKAPYAYFQSGLSYFKESRASIDRDRGDLEKAFGQMQIVLTHYPSSPYVQDARKIYDEINYQIAKKHFYIGRFYYRYKEYLAAIPRFQTIVNDYPKLGLENESYLYLIKALKKTKQPDLAMRYFEIFKEFYPDHKNAIKKMAGLF